jgi:hypothetical protein
MHDKGTSKVRRSAVNAQRSSLGEIRGIFVENCEIVAGDSFMNNSRNLVEEEKMKKSVKPLK